VMSRKSVILLFLLFVSSIHNGQTNGATKNEFRFFLDLFREADKPFKPKRHFPPNEYFYNYGLGSSLHFTHNFSLKFSADIETGFWYFYNNHTVLDPLYGDYRNRNLINPIRAGFEVYPIINKRLTIGISAKAGYAYQQNIHKFSDNSVKIYQSWPFSWQFGFTFFFFIRPLKSPPHNFTYRNVDYTFDFINKKYISSGHAEIWNISLK
jgi:hypothetical protein